MGKRERVFIVHNSLEVWKKAWSLGIVIFLHCDGIGWMGSTKGDGWENFFLLA